MPINPLKEFFKRTKAEVKFARAGPGQKLSASDTTGGSGSSSSAPPSGGGGQANSARQAAAEAAMKRFNKDTNTKPAQRPRISSQDTVTKSDPPKQTAESRQVEEKPVQIVQKELPTVNGVAQRSVQVYSTEELAQRIKQPEIDDDFFKLTIEDAKLFQQRYDEEKARNDILKTSEMRRREAEAKKPTTNVARLRFKLPNNMVLEASFSGHETLMLIRDWLMAASLESTGLELKNFDILFGLRPFKEADFQKTVKQLGLIPATTLTIVQRNT